MTNKPDDFEFDDFFDDSDNNVIGGDDEPPMSGEFDEDMPDIEEEAEPGNRTFVILAIAMILIFIIGVGIILVIAATPKGPNSAEATATFVVAYNATIQSVAFETATQDIVNIQATQTALAFTATPTETYTPSPTETPLPPTDTPTQDMTAAAALTQAFLQLDAISLTQTALAASPTPTNTLPPSPTQPGAIDLAGQFATEVGQATQAAQVDQSAYITQVAIATQVAQGGNAALIQQQLQGQQTLIAAAQATTTAVGTAVANVDIALATSAAFNATQSFNLALATSNAPGLQAPLVAAAQLATLGAQQYAATVTSLPPNDPAALGATATALSGQPVILTPAALATQSAYATRQSFVDTALGTLVVEVVPTDTPVPPTETPNLSLNPVNLTATAIAGAFLTATAQAAPATPTGSPAPVVTVIAAVQPTASFGPPPTALPRTGLFDDITGNGGGGVGLLGIALFGLVGVIVVARVMRSRNK